MPPGDRAARLLAMFEVRIHGRGGQGVVTAAELLSMAAFDEGRHAQAFPSFGSERMGAPVVAFCRIADRPIRLREPIVEPDALIVLDATLLHQVDLFAGLRPDGYVLINSPAGFDALGVGALTAGRPVDRLLTVAATEIALRHIGRPVPNTVLLGGFCAISGIVSLESLAAAVRERFGGELADANIAAAREAHAWVTAEIRELVHAPAD